MELQAYDLLFCQLMSLLACIHYKIDMEVQLVFSHQDLLQVGEFFFLM